VTRQVVDVRGEEEIVKLLDTLSGRELRNRTARATRKAGKIARPKIRAQAKRVGAPSRFTGSVAGGGIATKNHRTPIGTSVGPTSPLLSLFEPGVTAHRIGDAGDLMRGAEGDHYRSAPFLARGPVSHPGFAARPVIAPVFEAEKDAMSGAAMDELLAGIR
jgi:hypothetical protein